MSGDEALGEAPQYQAGRLSHFVLAKSTIVSHDGDICFEMMVVAALRLCRCGARVSGACPVCMRSRDRHRGTAASRGYGAAWQTFRPRFISLLVEAGLVPMCGAALPTGPVTTDSRCRDDGRMTLRSADGTSLHFDHEPPLAEHERTNPAAVCNPDRIQLLCAACHANKTVTGGT